MNINMIIKQKFGTVSDFCDKFGHDKTNFSKQIKRMIVRMDAFNKILEPLGLEVRIVDRDS